MTTTKKVTRRKLSLLQLAQEINNVGLIRRKASAAELYSVRIFDESLTANPRLLIAAIEWAMKEGMDLVNEVRP